MSMAENMVIHPANLVQAEGLAVGAVSGAITTIAAGGDVFGFRNVAGRPLAVANLRVRFVPTTAFASAQAVAFRVHKVYGLSKLHDTAGTSVQAHYKRQNQVRGSAVGDRVPLTQMAAYIAGTAAITGATYTSADDDEPEELAVSDGSVLPSIRDHHFWSRDGLCHVLEVNEGIVVKNHITMGTSGVGNLFVGFDLYRMP